MRRKLVGMVAGLVLAAVTAMPAVAQETGTPMYKAPLTMFRTYQWGADLSFPEGYDFGLEGFYQTHSGSNVLGLRGGVVKATDVTQFNIGAEFQTQVLHYSQSFPLDAALTAGAGLRVGEGQAAFLVPVGLSFGRRFALEGSNTRFVPYINPVIAPVFGHHVDSDVDFGVGLGVDIQFSRYLTARVSGGLGDDPLKGIGVGLAFTH